MRPEGIPPSLGLLLALNRAKVRWLLIGRQAVAQYGVPVQTQDYDLWADPSRENVRTLVETARKEGFYDTYGTWACEGRELLTIYKDLSKVDIFLVPRFKNLDGEVIDFALAFKRRKVAVKEGEPLEVPLPSLRDLKLLKRMRDSEKDREDLRSLDLLPKRGKPR